jgi:hypothetical protein
MGANAITTVPVYVSGEVLTAADMNITNSGIPVFATTVTRDAAFGGAGEKTLAEGQFAYIEATNTTQYYDGAAWATVGATGGMTLLSTTTLTGASTTISSIDQTYVQLYGVIFGMTNATGTGVFRLAPNGSTTVTNYIGVRFEAGTLATTQTSGGYYNFSGNGALTRTDANNIISFTISNYSSSTAYKAISNTMVYNSGVNSFTGGGAFNSNTAITSLVFDNSGGNLSTGTVLLYGVK